MTSASALPLLREVRCDMEFWWRYRIAHKDRKTRGWRKGDNHVECTWQTKGATRGTLREYSHSEDSVCSSLLCLLPPSLCMDSFDNSFENFQYDSASSYGGIGVVDDTSSIYTTNTTSHSHLPVDLEGLSITDDRSVVTSPNGHGHNGHSHTTSRSGLDEDFDGVLDDLKDEGQVDLPPHACRLVGRMHFF